MNFSFPSVPILGITALFTRFVFFFNMEKSSLLKLTLLLQGTLLCYVLEIQVDLPEMLISTGVINWNVFREGASSLKAPQQPPSEHWHWLVPEAHYLFGNQGCLATWLSSSSLIAQELRPVYRAERESFLPCKKFVFITSSHSKGVGNWI